MVTTTDAKNKEFVWVKRGNIWVKKYPAYLGPKVTQYTKGKTTSAKIQEISFKHGGYVYKDKHGREI